MSPFCLNRETSWIVVVKFVSLCCIIDTDAHRALEVLEDYYNSLQQPEDQPLRIAIQHVIRTFKSSLFQALIGWWCLKCCFVFTNVLLGGLCKNMKYGTFANSKVSMFALKAFMSQYAGHLVFVCKLPLVFSTYQLLLYLNSHPFCQNHWFDSIYSSNFDWLALQ